MTQRSLCTIMLLPVFASLAWAGTIQGTVSSANSVVYIDAITGKTFPAPTQNPVINQKGLKFNPAVLVVQVGTTVDFKN